VEIDPMVIDVAKRFFALRDSDRLRIHAADGRAFLARSPETWDLILVDAYTVNRYGETIPPHLVTQEFFTEMARHLNEGGIVHFHCAFAQSRLVPAIEKTMGSVFVSTLTTGGEIESSNVPLLLRPDVLAERARRSPAARLPSFAGYVAGLHRSSPPADAVLLTDDYAPVDTLLGRR
jgi:spermidine synthase